MSGRMKSVLIRPVVLCWCLIYDSGQRRSFNGCDRVIHRRISSIHMVVLQFVLSEFSRGHASLEIINDNALMSSTAFRL